MLRDLWMLPSKKFQENSRGFYKFHDRSRGSKGVPVVIQEDSKSFRAIFKSLYSGIFTYASCSQKLNEVVWMFPSVLNCSRSGPGGFTVFQ